MDLVGGRLCERHAEVLGWVPKLGRAAVVVPNGILFGDGVCASVKEQLLKEFNLHTIVRLPNGVFAPYTPIQANLLFFDRSAPTKDIWYYEQPTPEGRKSYSKTQPVQFEEFSDCIAWWNKRIETKRAWRASGEQVLKYDADGKLLSVNLDVKNPNGNEDIEHLPPARLVENILAKERKILSILEGIRSSLGVLVWQLATLGDVLRLRTPDTPVDPTAAYRFAGVYSFGRGVFRGIERKGMSSPIGL